MEEAAKNDEWHLNEKIAFSPPEAIPDHYEKPVLSTDTLLRINCGGIRQKNFVGRSKKGKIRLRCQNSRMQLIVWKSGEFKADCLWAICLLQFC